MWGGATKTKFLELERAQRCLIGVMFTKPYRFPTTELNSLTDIPSQKSIHTPDGHKELRSKNKLLVITPIVNTAGRPGSWGD